MIASGLLGVPALTARATPPDIGPLSPSGATTDIVVSADQTLGPTNPGLRGLVWNSGPIDGVAPIEPSGIRIDASLQSASRGPDDLDLSRLLRRISDVRGVGAEPLVLLSYMPPWLADSLPGDPRDPTRLAPRDMGAWQDLVEQVVEGVVTVPGGARRFEVWNEPNLPVFWQDTPAAFVEMATRTHAAVAAVEARTGVDLDVGGPATIFPDPSYIVPYHTTTTAAGVPPDFISWHSYFAIGQDGNEGHFPELAYELLRLQDNPFNTPMVLGPQVQLVRGLVGDDIELMINEWNVAGGGYDFRHDTHEGAAFQSAALTEMERAGLDAAYLYRAQDSTSNDGRIGDWGLVDAAGEPKPGWWVFDAWRRTEGTRVATAGDDPANGLWARATRSQGRIDVILSSFAHLSDTDRMVNIRVEGFEPKCATAQTIDSPDGSFAGSGKIALTENPTLLVPTPSIVWVRLLADCEPSRPPCASDTPPNQRRSPPTGPDRPAACR